MNVQQNVQTRSSSNGFGRRRVDRETGGRTESKMHIGRSSSSNFGETANGGKGGVLSPSRDRLIYVMTYLIGLRVEVHVKNGSIISGIFHATNADKDFGIVLKMAQVVRDGSVKGQKLVPDTARKPQTMIIPSRELVQVLAKDVPLTGDEFSNGHARDRRKDLMIDSAISHSHHVEVERELERWIPDTDDQYHDLDKTFDETWNRNWNQFETNEALFGVKSTFDEEIYTTKLERGPQMRDLEREASRIAREIEGEDTRDLHLAEERGIQFHEDFDLDEEIRYSAVHREIDDGRLADNENSYLDAGNSVTFGGSHGSLILKSDSDISRKKSIDEAQTLSTCSSVDDEASLQIHSDKDVYLSGSSDHVISLKSDCVAKKSLPVCDVSRLEEKHIKNQDTEKTFVNECSDRIASEEAQTSKSEDVRPSMNTEGSSPSAVTYRPSSSGQDSKHSSGESSESVLSGESCAANEPVNPSLRPGTSERVGVGSVSSGPGLSPSSSMGSLSSEKSTLNPYAKEFKLNPNAKSFTPSTNFRPTVPSSEGPFYYANNLSVVPPMHNMPMGVGMGPSFSGHQPVYNPQATQMQSPQAYIHPNGPVYGQQMILGQPRPYYFMPTYPPEMQYKGRNF